MKPVKPSSKIFVLTVPREYFSGSFVCSNEPFQWDDSVEHPNNVGANVTQFSVSINMPRIHLDKQIIN